MVSLTLIQALSCQENPVEDRTGYVSLSVQTDSSLEQVFTKAVQEPVLSLDIYSATGKLLKSYADVNEVAGIPVELFIGSYKAVVKSAVGAAAVDSPAYYGEQTFSIVPGRNAEVQVICKVANVKVTAAFDASITEAFTEYTLTVTNGESGLVFSNLDGTLSQEGWFSVTDHLTWTLKLVNKDGDIFETLTDTYTEVKAGQHYRLSFSIQPKPAIGGAVFEIVLDNSFNEKSYDLVLDFVTPDAPVFTGEHFELALTNKVYEGLENDGRFTIRAVKGLQSFQILHEDERLDQLGLARSNEFVGLTRPDLDSYATLGIIVQELTPGVKETAFDLSGFLQNLQKGSYALTFLATDQEGTPKKEVFNFTVVQGAPVEVTGTDAWAMYAVVHASWTGDQPDGLSLLYREKGSVDWIEAEAARIKIDPARKSYAATLWSLRPGIGYEVMAVTAQLKQSVKKTFTTDKEIGTLPNMSFDDWNKSGKSWYPNKSGAAIIWDTANEGANTNPFAETNPTVPDSKDVAVQGPGKSAAKMSSTTVVGNFTAGNIYTGDFGKAVMSPVGATLKWGVPFTSRPYALKGWYKYSPKTIDYAGGPYAGMKGKTDEMIIQIFLTDWKSPFTIDTAKGQFVDIASDPAIIAYGKVTCGQVTDGYVEFTIPLEYRDVKRKPTYIVISAAASRYGDYFTGAVGSTLWIDEFSFVYDPAEVASSTK